MHPSSLRNARTPRVLLIALLTASAPVWAARLVNPPAATGHPARHQPTPSAVLVPLRARSWPLGHPDHLPEVRRLTVRPKTPKTKRSPDGYSAPQ